MALVGSLARFLGEMQYSVAMIERPKVAVLATAGVAFLALKPLWKWLREPEVDRFRKVPGMGFFGVYFKIRQNKKKIIIYHNILYNMPSNNIW